MKQPYILLVGDAMLDVYFIGESVRISPEAPVPVVKVREVLSFEGGAGNVRANLLALGAKVKTNHWPVGPTITCPVKNRLIADGQQVARWDLRDICEPVESVWTSKDQPFDAVVISDYGKGSITPKTISLLADLDLPTFVDTKRSPREFEEIPTRTFFPNLKEYQEHLRDYALQPEVVLKRGAEGMEYHQHGKVQYRTSSLARKVVSVTGAGDTVVASFAYQYCKTGCQVSAFYFSNAAAAVVVGKPHTAVATENEVLQVLKEHEIFV